MAKQKKQRKGDRVKNKQAVCHMVENGKLTAEGLRLQEVWTATAATAGTLDTIAAHFGIKRTALRFRVAKARAVAEFPSLDAAGRKWRDSHKAVK